MNNELAIFLNPHAGNAPNLRQQLQEAFRAAGGRASITEARGPKLETALRHTLSEGEKVVGIAGGDGTISTAANVLAGSDTALLPIPLGTMNHFAQRYGIPSIEAAVQAWQGQSVHSVHVGSVNDRVFINNASCGFYPHAVRHRDRLEKVLPRSAAMWLAGIHVLAKLPLLELDIDTGNENRRVYTPALWVGIGRNSLRLPVPGDTAQSGVLEAVSGRAQTRAGLLALAFRLFRHLKRGLQPRDEHLDVLRAPTFTLHSNKAIDIALDGEPLTLRGPLTFAIRERALRVVCLVAPSE